MRLYFLTWLGLTSVRLSPPPLSKNPRINPLEVRAPPPRPPSCTPPLPGGESRMVTWHRRGMRSCRSTPGDHVVCFYMSLSFYGSVALSLFSLCLSLSRSHSLSPSLPLSPLALYVSFSLALSLVYRSLSFSPLFPSPSLPPSFSLSLSLPLSPPLSLSVLLSIYLSVWAVAYLLGYRYFVIADVSSVAVFDL